MGRKKRGRGRRRSEAAQLAAKYNERRLELEIDDAMAYQAHKKEHADHAKQIAKREEELLSRTIFVTNVKDLRSSNNLSLLKNFFQREYGPVEQCILASYSGKGGRGQRFPKARLRFMHERDAKAIFGGTRLSLVDSPVTLYDRTVGHRGSLRVFASKPYQGMDESSDENKVTLIGDGVLVGHYCPLDNDESVFARQDSSSEDMRDHQEFLIEDEINDGLTLSIDIDSRLVQIRLRTGDYKLSFRFKDVQDTLFVCRYPKAACYAIVLRLKYPPKIYKLRHEVDADGLDQEIGTRYLEMGGVRNETFGSCYGYFIRVSSRNLQPLFANKQKLRSLKRFGLIDRNLYDYRDSPHISALLIRGGKDQVDALLNRTQSRRVGMLLRSLMDNGRFCWYHALHDKVATLHGEKNIFELVDYAPWVQALSALESMSTITRPTRFPARVFYAFLQFDDDTEVESDDDRVALSIPEYCTLTPRLLLTPTRLAVVGFSVEMSNRVVRHFISKAGFAPESFLRVTIGEENGARLFSDQLSLCARIEHLILNGLSLHGYTYRFLAYSSSQLKESSLWMVNIQGSQTVESIRRWMGDFSMCKTPSKVAARMGQCFSTTVVASGRNDSGSHGVKDDFPDILSIHNGKEMCHSDGTGLIDRSVLETMIGRLPLGPDDPTDVSIVQIRFGGAKGTLACWDFSLLKSLGRRLPRSSRMNVLLRPSMVKFKAPYRQLEIISFGMKIPYYLNRNVVLLLKVHGMQDEIFLEMQREMLNDLDEMLIDSQKAMEMIPRLSGPDSSLSSALVHMLSCGLSPTNEPFLFSCLHAIRAHHLMNLRKKSRVFVDKGAVLMGGLDETGLVPEGCVFVQINKDGSSPGMHATKSKSIFEVLDGPVMVTKHPVVHPGDVRMLLAVDIPELRTHKNVILFSQHGSRPEADKMAGSDLDGDQFAVTWDERLFLGHWNGSVRHSSGTWRSASGETLFLQARTRTQDSLTLQRANKETMDFDPDSSENILSDSQDPTESAVANVFEALFGMSRGNTVNSATHDNAVNDEQLLGHFIDHAKNDNLGHIATMWLDYANKNGADCQECLKLAALHSIAVDFPKSGKPAEIPTDLYISRATARAHWREKKGAPSYDCEGALGRMYDEVVNKMRGDENSNSFTIPLAGRRFDRHGQILRFIERGVSMTSLLSEVYKPQMAIQLGLNLEAAMEDPQSRELELLSEAMDHRDEYEQRLIGLMSKYGLQCEGELLTGCIRKYHKLDKKRQHDLSESVRSQCRELRKNSRQTFFLYVLYTVCPDLYQEDSAEEDEETNWVSCIEALVTNKILPSECPFSETQMKAFKTLAFQLAAAYYEATYNTEMWWNEPSSHSRKSVLFSFPWIVADVMAFGLAPH